MVTSLIVRSANASTIRLVAFMMARHSPESSAELVSRQTGSPVVGYSRGMRSVSAGTVTFSSPSNSS